MVKRFLIFCVCFMLVFGTYTKVWALWSFTKGIKVTGGTTLKINASTVKAFDMQIVDNGTLTITTGELNLTGSFNYTGSGGQFNCGSSEVIFSNVSGEQLVFPGGTGNGKRFYDFTHSGNSTMLIQDSDLEIDGNFTNSDGAFDTDGNDMYVAGNWANSADFEDGNSTVTFDGTGTSTISGSTTFYDLSSTTAGKQITFTAGLDNETIVGHSLTLQGSSGAENLLKLRSSSSAQAYLTLDAGGSQNLGYLDVEYNNATRGQTLAAGPNSTDQGNNNNWTFKIVSLTLRNAGDTADYTTWGLGSADKDTAYIMTAGNCVLVKNNGNVNQDFALKGQTTNWTLSSATNTDTAVLMGLFNSDSAPLESAFSTTNDLLATDNTWATYEGDGSGKFQGVSDGLDVAANSGEKLYMYLKTPTSQTQGAQETITVTVTTKEHGT